MTADRSLIARLAAHESWAKTADASARTAPARRAMLGRFEHQVDPDGVLSPAERARRAAPGTLARPTSHASPCGQHRRGARRPPSQTTMAARAGQTRTNRSKRAALIDSCQQFPQHAPTVVSRDVTDLPRSRRPAAPPRV
jgi:hypothetical protein